MSIDALKQELAALNTGEQRRLTAYLVSLQDSQDAAYRKQLTEKNDKPDSQFATLKELDRRQSG